MKLSQRDKNLIWHPFTQEKTAADVIAIRSASGSHLYDEQGKSYLDLISSWWVNIHGHSHPEIAHSIYQQALTLDHVMFAGFTHTPAVELCEGLAQLLPPSLNRFFFSDNGSTAVEVALKMAYQYWYNQGSKERSIFLSFEGGYHGDTFGAMSVSCKSGFHKAFTDLCFTVLNLPYPDTWEGDPEVQDKEFQALKALDKYLEQYGSKIAAIILEPLIQGASGMRVSRASFLQAAIAKVRAHGILVIFDEVMTGFGRTGTHFALSQLDIIPDFLCVSKGITGGFLPLALTITQDYIYQAFLNDEWKYALAHGHSYTANPIACSAALTSLKLLQSLECQKAIATIHHAHHEGIALLRSQCAHIAKPRILGTIAAFEITNNISLADFKSRCFENGLLLRPLGQTVYMLPPYSTTKDALFGAYEKVANILDPML